MSVIVNLFAGPGAGKSTSAGWIFSELKNAGINCEMSREYAKDKVWEKNQRVFENQAYIFGKQYYRLTILESEVSVVITDSPLIFSAVYNTNPRLGAEFDASVVKIFNSYDNMNYFIKRVKPYNPSGRHQDEEGAKKLDATIESMLHDYEIPYKTVNGDRGGALTIASNILVALGHDPLEWAETETAYVIYKRK